MKKNQIPLSKALAGLYHLPMAQLSVELQRRLKRANITIASAWDDSTPEVRRRYARWLDAAHPTERDKRELAELHFRRAFLDPKRIIERNRRNAKHPRRGKVPSALIMQAYVAAVDKPRHKRVSWMLGRLAEGGYSISRQALCKRLARLAKDR